MNPLLKQKDMVVSFVLIGIVFLGVLFRFHNITENTFIYYDEGYYLILNRVFTAWLTIMFRTNPDRILDYLRTSFELGLSTGKPLWLFFSDLRSFFLGSKAWYFPRVLSAIFGSATILITFLFAKKYFQSKWVGFWSAVLLAVMPSHIYYSRLGLQEAFSTFCFVCGLYMYISASKTSVRTFLSGIFLAGTFYSNYRMIILPAVMACVEIFLCLATAKRFNWRRYIYSTLTFFFLVFVVGNIKDGRHTVTVFSWMFFQGDAAKGKFELFDLLAYPYYLFKLESVFFGLMFFINGCYVLQRQWTKLLPVIIVLFLMGGFSLVQDQATRYICVGMPLMCMAVATIWCDLYSNLKTPLVRWGLVVFMGLLLVFHVVKSNEIAHFTTDYESSAQDLLVENEDVKFISSQYNIQQLYADKPDQVINVPKMFDDLLMVYRAGYKYLILDPQIYVSHTRDKRRYNLQLFGYLDFVDKVIEPIRTYPHFNKALLERFVFEHNENFRTSLAFLEENRHKNLGQLRVYRVESFLYQIKEKLRSR